MRVQEDNALGFKIDIPETGYPLYGDKGQFHANNRLSLDKSGLRGKGGFDYLSSATQSDDYIFFPDSMNTHANTFDLENVDGTSVTYGGGSTVGTFSKVIPNENSLRLTGEVQFESA